MPPFGPRSLLGILLVLTLIAGGIPLVAPTACTDGCEDETGKGCFDCACCAPTRAPALVGEPVFPPAFVAALHHDEPVPSLRPAGPSDIFHVPRPAA